jgi:cell division septal protein FtsQ
MGRGTPRYTPRSQTRLMSEGPVVKTAALGRGAPMSLRLGRLFSVILLVLSCALLCVFLLDDRFRVQTVEVEGATLVAPEEVIAAADLTGRPVFLLNGRSIEAGLTESFGCFERVRVQPGLPDKVTVRVIEHHAMVLWEQAGVFWWLDREGVVLSKAMGRGALPVVHDRTALPVTVGSIIAGVPWEYLGQTIAALPAVTDFEYTLEDGLIVFVTTARWPVYLGSDGNAAYKVTVLRELTSVLTLNGSQVVYIDLKNERRPAIKLAAG